MAHRVRRQQVESSLRKVAEMAGGAGTGVEVTAVEGMVEEEMEAEEMAEVEVAEGRMLRPHHHRWCWPLSESAVSCSINDDVSARQAIFELGAQKLPASRSRCDRSGAPHALWCARLVLDGDEAVG